MAERTLGRRAFSRAAGRAAVPDEDEARDEAERAQDEERPAPKAFAECVDFLPEAAGRSRLGLRLLVCPATTAHVQVISVEFAKHQALSIKH